MLTDNKNITTPEYWRKVYEGKNDNARVDASNNVRPKNAFDRFGWAAKYAEGPSVLEVAAGHAHISKRIKAANPRWYVVASDQTESAAEAANFMEYAIFSVYNIPFPKKRFDTVIIAQAMEYLEFPKLFLDEAKRVARYIVITLPIGEMERWSQLTIFTHEKVIDLLLPYGKTEVFEREGELLLVKLKFND